MDLAYRKREKIVGAFVLSVAALLFISVVMIGRGKNWFESHVDYYVMFEESYDLQKSSAVKLHKANIGRVKRVEPSGNKVRIDITILKKFQPQITEKTYLTVKSPTIIGDEYLEVVLGVPGAPVLPEGSRIIALPKKSISDIMNEFQVEETARKFVAAVQNISDITVHLRDPEGALLLGLDELKATLANAARATSRAPEVMDHVNTNLITINKIGDEVYYNLSNIKGLLQSVEISLERLKVSLANVENASYDIPRITDSARKGLEEVRGTVDETEQVIESLKENFLIRGNLPPVPEKENIDAGLRK